MMCAKSGGYEPAGNSTIVAITIRGVKHTLRMFVEFTTWNSIGLVRESQIPTALFQCEIDSHFVTRTPGHLCVMVSTFVWSSL